MPIKSTSALGGSAFSSKAISAENDNFVEFTSNASLDDVTSYGLYNVQPPTGEPAPSSSYTNLILGGLNSEPSPTAVNFSNVAEFTIFSIETFEISVSSAIDFTEPFVSDTVSLNPAYASITLYEVNDSGTNDFSALPEAYVNGNALFDLNISSDIIHLIPNTNSTNILFDQAETYIIPAANNLDFTELLGSLRVEGTPVIGNITSYGEFVYWGVSYIETIEPLADVTSYGEFVYWEVNYVNAFAELSDPNVSSTGEAVYWEVNYVNGDNIIEGNEITSSGDAVYWEVTYATGTPVIDGLITSSGFADFIQETTVWSGNYQYPVTTGIYPSDDLVPGDVVPGYGITFEWKDDSPYAYPNQSSVSEQVGYAIFDGIGGAGGPFVVDIRFVFTDHPDFAPGREVVVGAITGEGSYFNVPFLYFFFEGGTIAPIESSEGSFIATAADLAGDNILESNQVFSYGVAIHEDYWTMVSSAATIDGVTGSSIIQYQQLNGVGGSATLDPVTGESVIAGHVEIDGDATLSPQSMFSEIATDTQDNDIASNIIFDISTEIVYDSLRPSEDLVPGATLTLFEDQFLNIILNESPVSVSGIENVALDTDGIFIQAGGDQPDASPDMEFTQGISSITIQSEIFTAEEVFVYSYEYLYDQTASIDLYAEINNDLYYVPPTGDKEFRWTTQFEITATTLTGSQLSIDSNIQLGDIVGRGYSFSGSRAASWGRLNPVEAEALVLMNPLVEGDAVLSGFLTSVTPDPIVVRVEGTFAPSPIGELFWTRGRTEFGYPEAPFFQSMYEVSKDITMDFRIYPENASYGIKIPTTEYDRYDTEINAVCVVMEFLGTFDTEFLDKCILWVQKPDGSVEKYKTDIIDYPLGNYDDFEMNKPLRNYTSNLRIPFSVFEDARNNVYAEIIYERGDTRDDINQTTNEPPHYFVNLTSKFENDPYINSTDQVYASAGSGKGESGGFRTESDFYDATYDTYNDDITMTGIGNDGGFPRNLVSTSEFYTKTFLVLEADNITETGVGLDAGRSSKFRFEVADYDSGSIGG